MRDGATATDDYLADWRRGEPIPVSDDLAAEADKAKADLAAAQSVEQAMKRMQTDPEIDLPTFDGVNQYTNESALITLKTRVAASGVRYPPGFRSMRMNSISFLITEFGSKGLPRKLEPFSTSWTAFAILCQSIGVSTSSPTDRA